MGSPISLQGENMRVLLLVSHYDRGYGDLTIGRWFDNWPWNFMPSEGHHINIDPDGDPLEVNGEGHFYPLVDPPYVEIYCRASMLQIAELLERSQGWEIHADPYEGEAKQLEETIQHIRDRDPEEP